VSREIEKVSIKIKKIRNRTTKMEVMTSDTEVPVKQDQLVVCNVLSMTKEVEEEELGMEKCVATATTTPPLPPQQEQEQQVPNITFIAKYGKERITIPNLHPQTTIGQVKVLSIRYPFLN
jgi:hypothetical protein